MAKRTYCYCEFEITYSLLSVVAVLYTFINKGFAIHSPASSVLVLQVSEFDTVTVHIEVLPTVQSIISTKPVSSQGLGLCSRIVYESDYSQRAQVS